MRDLTLLERIYAVEKGEKNLDAYNPARLQRSLVRHLTAMLNTRRGSVPIAPDYGLADLTDFGSSFTEESIHDIGAELERVITLYEPRLSKVHVAYTPRQDLPLEAVFRLEGEALTADGTSPLRFETVLDAAGSVSIKEDDDSRGYA
ncbi:MAG: type VI secretion system baseplate subunit TssE [Deltaproteobacteria bacterium]|jgi:type VI secretion system protein|nr:type VI secretion system baseplate subunit TssE [Deltaproteobacteria bacterium]